MDIRPTINDDGTETVLLYGKTVDVTGKDTLTLFKREYKIVRPKAKKKKTGSKSSEEEVKQPETED